MKLNWKHTVAAFAVLGMAISGPASAQSQSAKARTGATSGGSPLLAAAKPKCNNSHCRPHHIVIIFTALVAVAGGVALITSGGDDRPTSP
jgi:hypothetical protein